MDRIRITMREATPEDSFQIVAGPLRRAISWLAYLANLSTLTGLLGTVLGIHSTFLRLEAAGETSLKVFSGGIHEAIVTTIVGLLLAIPALIFHYLYRDRFVELETRTVGRLLREMERDEDS